MNRLLSLLVFSVAVAGFAGSAHARRPPRPPRPSHVRVVDPKNLKTVESELKATSERAAQDVRVQLARKVSEWLAADGVPASWTPPQKMIEAMIVGPIDLEPVKFHDLDVFKGTCQADFSPQVRHDLVEKYQRYSAGRLFGTLGGGLAFVLACLATLSGYIRADEATKGYYTNQLRLVAAAGLGAAGVVAYQILT